jgi:aminodeoxyfutalosine deaminase
VTDFAAAPKAELHLHLFGAIQPEVLLELARRNRVALPADTPEGVRAWYRYRDFDHFQEIMNTVASAVRTAEDVELITYELARELAGQEVRYAEVMFQAGALEARMPQGVYFDAATRARERARAELGIELRWIFDIARQLPDRDRRRYWADYTVEAAIGTRDQGTVALGLSGAEAGHPPEEFASSFERALGAGLGSAPHAGEHAGPASVWGAVRALGARRIAHGVRAIEDPALVAHLAERGIALDLCPTSNICLGVYPSYAAHPLRRLHEAGVPITVNSDDPPMFGTTLSAEVALLASVFGLDDVSIETVLCNGFRYAFAAEVAGAP